MADIVHSSLHFIELHIEARKTNVTLDTLVYGLFKLHHCMTRILLTFWRRNYFLILANSVYKMWIIQEPNKLELWNKLHFKEK